MLTATAVEIVETDQPNSARNGSMRTPGTARKAAAPTSARKVTPATHQAGWSRVVRAGTPVVTGSAWPKPAAVSAPNPPRCDQRLGEFGHMRDSGLVE